MQSDLKMNTIFCKKEWYSERICCCNDIWNWELYPKSNIQNYSTHP